MEKNNYISLGKLAEQLHMDKSACRRYILKLGIIPLKRVMPDSNHQLTLVLTPTQAKAVTNHRKSGLPAFESKDLTIRELEQLDKDQRKASLMRQGELMGRRDKMPLIPYEGVRRVR